jgi:hypothetical protein
MGVVASIKQCWPRPTPRRSFSRITWALSGRVTPGRPEMTSGMTCRRGSDSRWSATRGGPARSTQSRWTVPSSGQPRAAVLRCGALTTPVAPGAHTRKACRDRTPTQARCGRRCRLMGTIRSVSTSEPQAGPCTTRQMRANRGKCLRILSVEARTLG